MAVADRRQTSISESIDTVCIQSSTVRALHAETTELVVSLDGLFMSPHHHRWL